MEKVVSVIIPLYNVEPYVDRCLQSVLNQTMSNIEILCIDDCSTDQTMSIVDRYYQKDNRIKIFKNTTNRGLSYSRNVGIDNCECQYLMFLDSDDFLEKSAIETAYHHIVQNKADVLGFDYYVEYEDGNNEKKKEVYQPIKDLKIMTGEDFFKECLNQGVNDCMSWAYIYDKAFLLENRLKFDIEILHEDLLFYYQMVLKANRIGKISKKLYHYFRRSGSITSDNNNIEKKLESLCRISEMINKDIKDSKSNDLLEEKARYKRSIDKTAVDCFVKTPYFEDEIIRNRLLRYELLTDIQAIKYGGFFPWKLPRKELDKIKEFSAVLVYGAGKVGKGLGELLDEYGIDNYEFVVTDETPENNVKTIISWDGDKDNAIVIIAVKKYGEQLFNYARELGFNNIIYPLSFE